MKFHSIKNWSTKEYGKNALLAILGSIISSSLFNNSIFVRVIGDGLFLAAFILFFIWIYRKLKKLE